MKLSHQSQTRVALRQKNNFGNFPHSWQREAELNDRQTNRGEKEVQGHTPTSTTLTKSKNVWASLCHRGLKKSGNAQNQAPSHLFPFYRHTCLCLTSLFHKYALLLIGLPHPLTVPFFPHTVLFSLLFLFLGPSAEVSLMSLYLAHC